VVSVTMKRAFALGGAQAVVGDREGGIGETPWKKRRIRYERKDVRGVRG